jgi:hypothetical protein
MHTDEYEISLSREIDVCRNRIRAIKKTLCKMEQKYGVTTEQFLNNLEKGAGIVSGGDAGKWLENCAALTVWRDRQEDFEALYLRLKK